MTREVFDTDRGLWLANKKNELYPASHSFATEGESACGDAFHSSLYLSVSTVHSCAWYRFIGRILGKALYEGILIDVAFAGFFLAKWLDKQSYLDDLASLDPELFQGLMQLKHYTDDPEELSLNFTVAQEEFGETKSIDLLPNGSNIAVTRENRLQYMYLVAHYRLTKQIKKQSAAFFEGLSEIIDPKWLRYAANTSHRPSVARHRSPDNNCSYFRVGCLISKSCKSSSEVSIRPSTWRTCARTRSTAGCTTMTSTRSPCSGKSSTRSPRRIAGSC